MLFTQQLVTPRPPWPVLSGTSYGMCHFKIGSVALELGGSDGVYLTNEAKTFEVVSGRCQFPKQRQHPNNRRLDSTSATSKATHETRKSAMSKIRNQGNAIQSGTVGRLWDSGIDSSSSIWDGFDIRDDCGWDCAAWACVCCVCFRVVFV